MILRPGVGEGRIGEEILVGQALQKGDEVGSFGRAQGEAAQEAALARRGGADARMLALGDRPAAGGVMLDGLGQVATEPSCM